MKLSQSKWERVLLRWCEMEHTGEVRLLCAVIAEGIATQDKDPWFFSGGGFSAYCRAIGLDPEFVLRQIERADAYEMTLEEEAA